MGKGREEGERGGGEGESEEREGKRGMVLQRSLGRKYHSRSIHNFHLDGREGGQLQVTHFPVFNLTRFDVIKPSIQWNIA